VRALVDVVMNIIALMMEAVRRSAPTRLHGASSQKALSFILSEVFVVFSRLVRKLTDYLP
jgi:hypothetical protein